MIISDNPTADLFPVFRPVSRLLDDMVDFFFREQGRHVNYFMVWIYCQMIASRNSSSKTLESTKNLQEQREHDQLVKSGLWASLMISVYRYGLILDASN